MSEMSLQEAEAPSARQTVLISEALNSYKIIYSRFWGSLETGRKLLKTLVGAEGFEPPASCSQSRRATRLRHAPILSTAEIAVRLLKPTT